MWYKVCINKGLNEHKELTTMDTECSVSKLEFQGLNRRRVEAEFNGGQITSDAGGLLLREVESRYGFIRGLAACFGDRRDPRFTEFQCGGAGGAADLWTGPGL